MNDTQGYADASILKEENCTLAMIQGSAYETSEDEYISDESLNEFWHKEEKEL